MKKIMKNGRRFIVVLAVLLAAILLVYVLSSISSSATGPINTLVESTKNWVEGLEKKYILNKKENARSKSLEWFSEIKTDKSKIVNSKYILFGASDNTDPESYESIIALEDSLELHFPIIHIYKAWGEKQEHMFPETEVNTISNLGSVPMITWEPWLSAFSTGNYPGIESDIAKRDKGSLAAIAAGEYDKYIIKWATECKNFNLPVLLRFAHEMNDPYHYQCGPQNNEAYDFIAAWKHVHNVFVNAGATNVIWLWNPHLSYSFDEFYPGDEYVDIISFGVLNFGTSVSWSQWWTFEELLSNSYEKLKLHNKPMMISEFGSLVVGGDRSEWFKDAFAMIPEKYSQIRSIVFFHYSNEKSTDKSLNWQFADDKKVLLTIKASISSWDNAIRQPMTK